MDSVRHVPEFLSCADGIRRKVEENEGEWSARRCAYPNDIYSRSKNVGSKSSYVVLPTELSLRLTYIRPQPTNHHDLIFSHRISHNAQREEIPGGFGVNTFYFFVKELTTNITRTDLNLLKTHAHALQQMEIFVQRTSYLSTGNARQSTQAAKRR